MAVALGAWSGMQGRPGGVCDGTVTVYLTTRAKRAQRAGRGMCVCCIDGPPCMLLLSASALLLRVLCMLSQPGQSSCICVLLIQPVASVTASCRLQGLHLFPAPISSDSTHTQPTALEPKLWLLTGAIVCRPSGKARSTCSVKFTALMISVVQAAGTHGSMYHTL